MADTSDRDEAAERERLIAELKSHIHGSFVDDATPSMSTQMLRDHLQAIHDQLDWYASAGLVDEGAE